jgi:hypothetical protein
MATIKVLAVAACAAFLAACGSDGGGETANSSVSPAQSPGQSATNSAPRISGTPALAVAAGEEYAFRATAVDAEGDALTFTASNLPAWAHLDAATGEISGTPEDADVGNYPGITLTVSDGRASASLPPFAITVDALSLSADGRATLSWSPPTENTDGTALTDLASYRILYGRNPSNLSKAVQVANPSVTSYVVENLASGKWYFAVIAVNNSGVSSTPSNVASKTI